ncbi:helix-turn-helix domain-containing protein [Bacillus sp. AFS017336]|uniref:helix-turn-helix domain-containing protein n=1 Tax=Bacillus sp. AFS017336 TaxID=2033489 RepID=UPI0015CF3056|nr:helix-turn-helix domain-containing protein [Bacillus sp. AFS017336]
MRKTELSQNTGIHNSDLSRVFNHKQTLSLSNLDAITEALELVEGALYSYYLEECFNENGYLDKRRTVQFLYRCITDDYEKLSRDLLYIMTEEKLDTIHANYLSYICSVAEKLFLAGKEEKALALYDLIIEKDRNGLSDQLAISYFRRFYIVRMSEDEQYALTYVLEHLMRIPRKIRKDAYLWIAAFYYRREKWEEVLYYAEKLENMVENGEYYGRALMYKSFALARLGGTLEEILAYIDRYAQVNDYFAEVAVGNRYIALLDFGQLDYSDDYLYWLKDREDIYVGLPRVLEAYVLLNRLDDAKRLLDSYRHSIDEITESKDLRLKQKIYLDFHYAFALYQCKSKLLPDGLDELLEVAYSATQLGNLEKLKKCLLVYWEFRDHVTEDQRNKYIELLSTNNIRGNSYGVSKVISKKLN